ncbi:MAG: hypothetical protein EOP87_10095 [Verrucomicrobiaceae bacterium]|nr:MAG: hypothetical protein EOP87_10095 [Verrucomicrobiaceae bacterium]
MTTRPLYRSKTLWLGILVLIFLGWAWHVSLDRFTLFRLDNPLGYIAIGQYQGEAGLFSMSGSRRSWNLNITDVPRASRISSCREIWERATSNNGVVVASHGWLILAFTLPWLALLARRSQRMKRHATGSAGRWPAEPSSSSPPCPMPASPTSPEEG